MHAISPISRLEPFTFIGSLQLFLPQSNRVRELALMSCSLAEQRLDQLYGVREVKRSRLVVEVWGVGSSRRKELHGV